MSHRFFKHTFFAACVGLLTALATPSVGRADPLVEQGWDLFETAQPTSVNGIPFVGVPLGTFDFTEGTLGDFGRGIGVQSTGNADTIVKRLDVADGSAVPFMDTIGIEMVALQLMSAVPVDFGAGLATHFVTLQSDRGGPLSQGNMTITFGPEGVPHGTFDSNLLVFFDIRQGGLAGPIVVSDALNLTANGVPWQHDGTGFLRIEDVNFLLKGDGTIDRDFFPIGLFQEIELGTLISGIHTVGSSGPDRIIREVPEPSTLVLLSLGALALMVRRRRGGIRLPGD